MKYSKLAYAGVGLCIAIVVLYRRPQQQDPVNLIFEQLRASAPRSKIIYAKQLQGGREPTFAGVVLMDDQTRQTLSWNTIGCIRADSEPHREEARRVVMDSFKDYPDRPPATQLRGFEVWVGTIQKSPYFLSVLVSETNAYLVFQHY